MPEGSDSLARDPSGARPDRTTPQAEWAAGFTNVQPPPRPPHGRGARAYAENQAARQKLADYAAEQRGAHQSFLLDYALSHPTQEDHAAHAAAVSEVSRANSRIETAREVRDHPEYWEDGTHGQLQDTQDMAGGRFGRLSGSIDSNLHEVFHTSPSSLSGYSTPLTGLGHNPPPPAQTSTSMGSYPAFKPLPPGPTRPPNQ